MKKLMLVLMLLLSSMVAMAQAQEQPADAKPQKLKDLDMFMQVVLDNPGFEVYAKQFTTELDAAYKNPEAKFTPGFRWQITVRNFSPTNTMVVVQVGEGPLMFGVSFAEEKLVEKSTPLKESVGQIIKLMRELETKIKERLPKTPPPVIPPAPATNTNRQSV